MSRKFVSRPGRSKWTSSEARIFDHRTRALISQSSEAYGWRVSTGTSFRYMAWACPCPNRSTFGSDSTVMQREVAVVKLAPSVGSTCTLDGGTFTVQDIRSGHRSFSSSTGFGPPTEDNDDALSLLLTDRGDESEARYQIVAVSTNGETVYSDLPHFLRFHKQSQPWPIFFDVGLKELDHFELRPFGGRHRFFFDSVVLPKISARAFALPPKVKIAINGQEISQKLSTFAPLEIKIATFRGDEFSGSTANESRGSLIHRNPNQSDDDKEFTVAKWARGLSPQRWNFRYFAAKNRAVSWGNHSTAFGGTATGGAAYETFGAPLEQLEEVEVTLIRPPNSNVKPGSQPKMRGMSR